MFCSIQFYCNIKSGVCFAMKRLALIVLSMLIAGCSPNSFGNAANSTQTPVRMEAVYLFQGQPQLPLEELQKHPEIVVVQSFDELKQYTNQEIAIWVDKSVVPLTSEQQQWMNEAPQAYYPVVLVGYSDTLYSFRDLLGLCCFMGPALDDGGENLNLGFSIIQREEMDESQFPAVTFLEGYSQIPTIQAILEITNELLQGKLRAIPTSTYIPISTPTMAP